MSDTLEKVDAPVNVPKLRFPKFEGQWCHLTLAEVGEITTGTTPSTSEKANYDGDFLFVSPADMGGMRDMHTTQKTLTKLGLSKTRPVPKDSVLFVCIGSTIGKVAQAGDELATNQQINSIYANPKHHNDFIFSLLEKQSTKIKRLAGIQAVPLLSKSEFSNIRLFFAPLAEQQKIADFLSAVDGKITLLQDKRNQLQQYKKGVMQQLFSQQLRFPEFQEKWKEQKIDKFIDEHNEKTTTQDQYEVLTSARFGLISQEDYFENERISKRDNIGFNIIPQGYMTYRTRSDDRKFFFNENNLGKTGIISTYYPVFKINNGVNLFFINLFLFHQNHIGKFSVGTSQTVLSMNELRKIRLPIPTIKEQQKIADFLIALNSKIDAVAQQLAQMQDFKKGLLQQMFV